VKLFFLCAECTNTIDSFSFRKCEVIDAAQPPKPIAIFKQFKHTNKGAVITASIIINWVRTCETRLVNYTKKYDVILAFVTNRYISKENRDLAIKQCSNLIIVHKDCLSTFFSPTLVDIACLADKI